jgi:hypothetical protein
MKRLFAAAAFIVALALLLTFCAQASATQGVAERIEVAR